MKRFFYYLTPFVLIPVVMIFYEYIDNTSKISMSPYICIITLIFISMIMGNLSHTQKRFDYVLSAVMPISLFCFAFIIGFLSKCDLETRFHLDKAFKTAFQHEFIVAYCCMAIFSFLCSYERFGLRSKHIQSNKNH